jgi:3-oxoacyl-(acyl-carrier-protein) synthase
VNLCRNLRYGSTCDAYHIHGAAPLRPSARRKAISLSLAESGMKEEEKIYFNATAQARRR